VGLAYKQKEKKEMEKKKWRGCCGLQSAGLAWAFFPGLAQLAAVFFFVLFFSIFCPLFILGFGLK
jgi:hypothetical protein